MTPKAGGASASILSCSKTSGSSDSSAARAPLEDNPGDVLSLSCVSLAATDPIFGLHAIELWSYDEATGKLLNVRLASRDEETGLRSGGLLVKRRTRETDPANEHTCRDEALIAFDRLTDASRKDFLPPVPTDPGVGLPGVLWAGGSSASAGARLAHSLSGARLAHSLSTARLAHSLSGRQNVGGGETVVWRDVAALADDPDQVCESFSFPLCFILISPLSFYPPLPTRYGPAV